MPTYFNSVPALLIANFSVQLGTIVSGYGWWLSSNKPVSANGTRRDLEENTYRQNGNNRTIKLQSHYAQEEIQLRAGFWGYLMQIAFQVG